MRTRKSYSSAKNTWVLPFSWDQIKKNGKMTPYLTPYLMEPDQNRIYDKENQLLCITKTADATGRVEAAAAKKALDNWGISTDTIIDSSFDTTSSNTGVNSGGAVLLQQLLNRQLLWLSCRHHVAELILKAAFQSLFGKTTATFATLFSTLKSSCSSLDLFDLHLPPTPVDPILSFLYERLLPENAEHLTRRNYKELLEVAKVCLGGTVTRKRGYTFTLARPGADSNAIWMSKCLYVLKFSLLQHQFPSLTAVTKKTINTMSSFILFAYLSYWFTSPSLTRAASNDLKMFQQSSVRILSPCPLTTYLVSDRRPCPCSPLQQRLGG